jgi:RNA polymerase sigma-70 factor (ECF subfamily)
MTGRAQAAADVDADLVERAAGGESAAFEALVESRLNRAFCTASAILGNEADAADVVQDAFVSAWRHLPSLRDGTKFDAWLTSVIVNRCRDVLRQQRRSREVALERAPEPADVDAADAVADAAAVDAAFDQLRADHRYLLVMHHVHRVPVAELARLLGVPEGTAKWRLHSARAALERALEATNG